MQSSRTCARPQGDASVWHVCAAVDRHSARHLPNPQRAATPPQFACVYVCVCVGSGQARPVKHIDNSLVQTKHTPNGAARVYQGNVSKVRARLESISSQGIRSFTSAECDLLLRCQETVNSTDWLGRLHAASVPHSTDTLSLFHIKYAVCIIGCARQPGSVYTLLRKNTVPSSISPTRHETSQAMHRLPNKESCPAVASVTLAP